MNNQYTTLELRVHRSQEMPDNSDIPDLLKEWGMHAAAQESFWVITYDSGRNMRTVTEVARGSYRDVMVNIPAVMAAVHKSGTDRFVVVHNHPAGDKSPTVNDMELTRRIMDAANMSGLYFEDHLIVTPSGEYTSLASEGLLIAAPDLNIRAQQGAVKARRPRRISYILACSD